MQIKWTPPEEDSLGEKKPGKCKQSAAIQPTHKSINNSALPESDTWFGNLFPVIIHQHTDNWHCQVKSSHIWTCLCAVCKCFRVIQSCASMKRGWEGHDGNNCNKRPPLPLKRLHHTLHTLDLLSPYLKRISEGPNTLSTLQIYFPPIA